MGNPEKQQPILLELQKEVPVENFITHDAGTLSPLDNNQEITEHDIQTIVSICSQPILFDTLFADLKTFADGKYEKNDAEYWVNEHSKKGWVEQSKFVYVVRNAQGTIVCAIEIMSTDLEGAEIGYWADENNPGWMTNTVQALLDLARNAGYSKLYGLVRKTNAKSEKVLRTVGFSQVEAPNEKEENYNKFEITL